MSPARMSFGATLLAPDRTRFRFWAPDCESVSLVIEGAEPVVMAHEPEGWHVAECACGAGTQYRYRIGPDRLVPDPASRAQAGDVHDPSVVIDPAAYVWHHPDWAGRPWHEAVIYELHVGALGGFAAVTRFLPHLAELGVTAVELMPIADFPGPRNWGYDGVLPYAPEASYGTPDELRQLIDAAHGLGLMVFLDVVYNHFGPEGNYIGVYAPGAYRHDRQTPWGDAIDFRRPQVRRFFIENALYWLQDFRFDGLRLDAVHAIADRDFLLELADEVRGACGSRHIHLVLENEENDAGLLRTGPDARGYDAQWADDLHHCVHVLITGEAEGYYENFLEAPAAMLARCLREGFAYQGELAPHNGRPRGTPSGYLPPTAFVICLQNHDQIGNRALGERLSELARPEALRAATVLLLLTPQIPLLFMGQEWASKVPFLYFASFSGELADAVRKGRRTEFAAFAAFADKESRHRIPDPNDEATFAASTLQKPEGADSDGWMDLHRRLLAIRAEYIVPRLQGARAEAAEPLGTTGVAARWRMGDGAVLSMAVNFGETALPYPAMEGIALFETFPGGNPDVLPPLAAVVRLKESG